MNTKKLFTVLLLIIGVATVLSLSGCPEPCGTPPNPTYENIAAPNGETLRVEAMSCFARDLRSNLEVSQHIALIQGEVTAGSAAFDPMTINTDTFTFTQNAAGGFTATYKENYKQNNAGRKGRAYLYDTFQEINDVYTFAIEYAPNTSAPKSTSAQETIEKYYGNPKIVRISADFTGTLYAFAMDTYTLGVKKNTEQKTLGAPSTLLYTDEITRFVSIFGNALATELTNKGVQFLDTKKTDLPVSKEKMFFDEADLALESVWTFTGLSNFNFYYIFKKDADPAAIRALMQAAEAVNDPRLLLIERAAATDNLKITAFGAVAFDAVMPANGYEFIWDFTGANLQKVITDDLLRAIQVEYTEDSVQ